MHTREEYLQFHGENWDDLSKILQGEVNRALSRSWGDRSSITQGIDPIDVVMEVVLRLESGKIKYDPNRGTIQSFLTTVVRNRAIDKVRLAASQREISVDQRGLADRRCPEATPEEAAVLKEKVLSRARRERARAKQYKELMLAAAQDAEDADLEEMFLVMLQRTEDKEPPLKRREVAQELGWDVSRVDNATKRLKRHEAKILKRLA